MYYPGAELPGPRPKSLREHGLRIESAARDAVRLASVALSSTDSVLLGLVAERLVPQVRVTLISWNFELARGAGTLSALPPSARKELLEVGATLIGELARRWPANAVPTGLGVVTDGQNLLFSAQQPSPLSPSWFEPPTLNRALSILPMRQDGILAHLVRPASGTRH